MRFNDFQDFQDFQDFLKAKDIAVAAVDRFDGYAVTVGLPPDWKAAASPPGSRVWVWPADPFQARFCANLVLTQTRVEATLDHAEVFAMLCEWTVNLYPGTYEYTREVAAAGEGPGILGRHGMLINTDVGVLASESLTRILTESQATLITQSTLTSLADSPVDRAHIRLAVTTAAPPDSAAPTIYHGTTGAEVR